MVSAGLWLLLMGCGYRFTAGGAALPGGIRRVYLPILVNKTSEPGVETLFTQALREQLVRAGVDGDSSSDAQLMGELANISGAPTIFTPHNQLASYRLVATLRLRLRNKGVDVVNGAVVVDGQEDFLPGSNILESEANRSAALRRLSESMARDAYERLAHRW